MITLLNKNICRNLVSALLAATLMTACQTSPKLSATDQLFKGIPGDRYGLYTSTIMHRADDDACLKFYNNAAEYAAMPINNTRDKILEIVLLTAIAGGATYGVGAIGISNVFASLSLASATNQVVYSGGKTVLDSKKQRSGDLAPAIEIADAAVRLGCPAPTVASFKEAMKPKKNITPMETDIPEFEAPNTNVLIAENSVENATNISTIATTALSASDIESDKQPNVDLAKGEAIALLLPSIESPTGVQR